MACGTIEAYDSLFEQNSGYDGGAIWAVATGSESGHAYIEDCTFNENTAVRRGGGLAVVHSAGLIDSATAYVYSSQFSMNSGEEGGAASSGGILRTTTAAAAIRSSKGTAIPNAYR